MYNNLNYYLTLTMHCLFLGIAKWIVKRIWIEEGVLTSNILEKVQKKMNTKVAEATRSLRDKCGHTSLDFKLQTEVLMIAIFSSHTKVISREDIGRSQGYACK